MAAEYMHPALHVNQMGYGLEICKTAPENRIFPGIPL
jgi:hypothetical protein